MSELDSECDDSLAALLADVADEFLARRGRGEEPTAAEYAARYPWAAEAVGGVIAALRLAASPCASGFGATAGESFATPLGDYRILREIGRGGMGVVYEAEQVSLHRRVALKMFSAAGLDARRLQRFQNEARAFAALDHPHIVKVHGVGCESGRHFIALQLIDGYTLAEVIHARQRGVPSPSYDGGSVTLGHPTEEGQVRRPPLPADSEHIRRVAVWGVQAAEALDHAHGHGLVHRDVKPGNLLVNGRGILFVADFGLAKLTSGPDVTASGDLLGTVRYMSPEQAAARHDLVDHRSDVYSLGATLYELLALRPVFAGEDSADILRRIAQDEPAPLRRFAHGIPRDLETVILTALAKDPARRYQSAQDLADDLRRFLDRRPILARPPSSAERLVKWAGRHRPLVAAGLVSLAAVAAALLVSTLLIAGAYEAESRSRREAEDATGRAEDARRQALEREAALRLELYPTRVRQAQEAWNGGEVILSRELLDHYAPMVGARDEREFGWRYLDACLPRGERVFGDHADPLLFADVSADGRLVATSDRGGTVKLWDATAGRELHSTRYSNQEVTQVRFSPDGQTLACCGQDRTIRLFDVVTWSETACLRGHTLTVTSVSWSPDGTRLVSGGRDHLVKIWDVRRGDTRTLVGHRDVVRCVAWSPTGKLVASAGKDQGVHLWDPVTGESAGLLEHSGPGSTQCLAFNATGELVASGGYLSGVQIHDVRTRKLTQTVPDHAVVWSLAFSRDGDRYLAVGMPGRVEVWDRGTPGATAPMRVLPHPGRARALAFTRDDRYILTASEEGKAAKLLDTSHVWGCSRIHSLHRCWLVLPGERLAAVTDADQRLELRSFPGGEVVTRFEGRFNDVTSIASPPAGDVLVTSHSSGRVSLWNPVTGRRIRDFPGSTFFGILAAISPDGKFVAATANSSTLVWRTDTGKSVASLVVDKEGGSHRVAFSPDGTVLATAEGDFIILWQVGTWARLATLPAEQRTVALAFSPDSRVLATGGLRGGVHLWEVDGGRHFGTLAGHSGWVSDLAFSPDGRTLATAGSDRTVRLWHVPTWRELFVLYRHDADLGWVRFASPDRLLVGGVPSERGGNHVRAFPPIRP